MSRWRPEGWDNPYKDRDGCWEWQCFERGADAVLEALCPETEISRRLTMREKIAIYLKQIRQDTRTDYNGVAIFIHYPASSEQVADQILTLISEEIEKAGLSDEEFKQVMGERELGYPAEWYDSITVVDLMYIAQAQLRKILNLLSTSSKD